MQADELAGQPIGARIQVIRERQGKTRTVVAGLVGRSPQWLKDVERGRRLPPRWDMLVRLAQVLHVDVTALTGDAGGHCTGISAAPRGAPGGDRAAGGH